MTSSSSARPSRRPTRGRGAAQGRPKAGAGRQKSAPVARPQEFTMPEPLTPALPPVDSFGDMDMPEALLKTLAAQGVTEPFPIQAATLPNSLVGRDLLGRGRTGSGKTLAFGLALLARTAGRRAQPKQPLALVLVPTRELAQQVTDAMSPYATSVNLRITTVVGGMSINRQSGALRRGAEVLVATPGRLKDLIDRGDADLSQVSITVLDEADQMTDMGFMPQVTALLKQVRPDGQTMLFSATLDKNIDKLVKMFLTDPVAFSVDPSAGAVSTMEHHVLYVMDETDKKAVATRIAARDGRVIMFVDTKRGVDRMVKKLLADGVRASGLHGGRSQPQRNRTLDWFKTGEVTALVATNVAARGIHIDDLDLVVNVDPPTDHKDYLHRGGRTARAGESGSVVTLVLPDQKRDMTRLMSDAGISPHTAQIKSSDEELARITGAKEPSGIPVVMDVPQATPPRQRSAGQAGGGSGSGARRRSGGPRTGSGTGAAPAAGGGRGRRTGGGAAGQAPASGSGQARRGQGGQGGSTGGSGERARRTGGAPSGGAAAASARSRVGGAGQGRRRSA
ncbi:DEAD/DEAH box helicase [Streptomyces sp. NBC_00335]|uniref:DEAD/DEAH box helicase n=1 Tax=unclassified Streptomyces TaxID=2593676 RepID=UPI00225B5FF3|nr:MULTISPECIES: DEAD/DEAH box helicase [unclassified Streptomyces]MCX5407948.1 DEAD/DEAH box helicase [Streptomyces sp. NBC_00086]